jgi:transketolase
MPTTIEKIAHEAASMTREERLTLVRLLLDIDQLQSNEAVTTAWDQDIRARIKAVDDGRAAGISYASIKKEMSGRFAAR